MSRVTISRLIEKLEEIEEEHGDLYVQAVNYHSDYRNEDLTEKDLDVQVVVEPVFDRSEDFYNPTDTGERTVLIYGGSY